MILANAAPAIVTITHHPYRSLPLADVSSTDLGSSQLTVLPHVDEQNPLRSSRDAVYDGRNRRPHGRCKDEFRRLPELSGA